MRRPNLRNDPKIDRAAQHSAGLHKSRISPIAHRPSLARAPPASTEDRAALHHNGRRPKSEIFAAITPSSHRRAAVGRLHFQSTARSGLLISRPSHLRFSAAETRPWQSSSLPHQTLLATPLLRLIDCLSIPITHHSSLRPARLSHVPVVTRVRRFHIDSARYRCTKWSTCDAMAVCVTPQCCPGGRF